MNKKEQPAVYYQLSDTVDVLAAFDRAGIEHLEVSAERTIVIYSRTIFDFEIDSGRLEDAQTVTVEVFDISPDLDADTDSVPLIETLVEELATTASVDWERR
ncbi:hypothetical protein [Halalkalicoccus jeotgali]|uniref:Uncharacterized protein n=1 Tax=Halalkalicoccus jeotgali (strain DSM 18796 / CECT 7217 / JCM 14584 / KCTC 4019 / B3) TaxID=795797 RepID=D8JC24_HALJB|nr:hypothetical protein [Halalkalicoccus jeotgali]ADJ16931.1 hypothetical protein HacjB3_17943 [Halalkalicoccus jeotgali B3]ELY38632.1 hypothetical protein C497_06819 [Halalkalicoccus jeotgali B3]